ncbi:B-cell receptor CD22-like isoform X2 [Heptranchias perlo]|uniref:B-cell receptor CD22-like isoform X2 n=1 Tax=Heptranchias perlo TaxID=212740 RepID=UPI00355A65CD
MTSLRTLFLTLILFQDVLGYDWDVKTPGNITGIEDSCVVIPCTFQCPGNPNAVMWLKGDKTSGIQVINSTGKPDSAFEGRAQFLANWKTEKDCTLKINKLRKSDKGTYYFRMERNIKYSDPKGVTIDFSDAPSLINISTPARMIEGEEVSLVCSVKYLCADLLRWYSFEGLNRSTSTETKGTAQNGWITSRTLSFVPSYKDDGKSLSCGLQSTMGESHRKNITLNVEYAPKDVYIASSRFTPITKGVTITLRCMFSTSNPPVTTYKWTGNSHWTRSRTRQTYVTPAFHGNQEYTCEASNSVGTTSSDKIKLVILEGKTWAVWTPLSLTAREHSCVTIPCQYRHRGEMKNSIWLKGHNYHGARVYQSNGEINANYSGRVEILGGVEDNSCTLKIKNLTVEDSGKYYFRMETASNKWSSPTGVNLLVSEKPEKPEIEAPESITEGKTATVTCTVKSFCSEDIPVLAWLFPYPNSSTSSETQRDNRDNMWIYSRGLTFIPTYEERDQTLKCQVVFGKATASAASEIQLNIKHRPRNITISLTVNGKTGGHSMKESDVVTLICSTHSSNPAVSDYNWYKDGIQVGRNHDKTLRFSSITYTDYGAYSCQANNEVGSGNSEDLTLRGKYRPRDFHISYIVNGEIVEFLRGIRAGDQLNISCVSANSDPAVSGYAWYNSERSIVRQSSLQFLSITEKDRGGYHCQASNEVGTGISSTINIEVLYPPRDVNVVLFGSAIDGKFITLQCQSDAKPQAGWYRWRKTCEGDSTNLGSITHQLTFQVSVSDASCDYYCTAGNTIDEKMSQPKRFTVQYKPRDVKIISSGSEREESLVSLSCKNNANPPVYDYTWMKRCNRIPYNLQQYKYSITIKITSDDALCDYYCTAKNAVGHQDSPNIRINVKYSPKDVRVTRRSPTGEVKEGDKVILSCSSTGNPRPQYNWYKDSPDTRSIKEGSPELIFNLIRWDDSGTYYCKVTNEIGSANSKQFPIDVIYGPRYAKVSTSSPMEVIMEGDNVTLTCSSDGNPPVNRYRWFRTQGDSTINLERPSKDLTLYGITREQEGLYFCEASNRVQTQRSEGQRIEVLSRHTRLIIIVVIVLLAFLTVVVVVFLILRWKKTKTDSLNQPDTDIGHTVYSVIMKHNKSKENTVYENMVMTEVMASNCNQSPLRPEDRIEYASINFTHGSRDIGGRHQKDTAWPTGKENSRVNRQADEKVIYGLVHKAPPSTKVQQEMRWQYELLD